MTTPAYYMYTYPSFRQWLFIATHLMLPYRLYVYEFLTVGPFRSEASTHLPCTSTHKDIINVYAIYSRYWSGGGGLTRLEPSPPPLHFQRSPDLPIYWSVFRCHWHITICTFCALPNNVVSPQPICYSCPFIQCISFFPQWSYSQHLLTPCTDSMSISSKIFKPGNLKCKNISVYRAM